MRDIIKHILLGIGVILGIILISIFIPRLADLDIDKTNWTGFYYQNAAKPGIKTKDIFFSTSTVRFTAVSEEECLRRGTEFAKKLQKPGDAAGVLLCGHRCSTNIWNGHFSCSSNKNTLYTFENN